MTGCHEEIEAEAAHPRTATARLRIKNQVTIPELVVQALGMKPGDRMLFVADQDPGALHIYRARDRYAGALDGVYGTAEEAEEYLDREREAWDE